MVIIIRRRKVRKTATSTIIIIIIINIIIIIIYLSNRKQLIESHLEKNDTQFIFTSLDFIEEYTDSELHMNDKTSALLSLSEHQRARLDQQAGRARGLCHAQRVSVVDLEVLL